MNVLISEQTRLHIVDLEVNLHLNDIEIDFYKSTIVSIWTHTCNQTRTIVGSSLPFYSARFSRLSMCFFLCFFASGKHPFLPPTPLYATLFSKISLRCAVLYFRGRNRCWQRPTFRARNTRQ